MENTESRNSTPETAAAPRARRRKAGWPRILLWSAGGLLTLLLLAAGAGLLWLRSAAIERSRRWMGRCIWRGSPRP